MCAYLHAVVFIAFLHNFFDNIRYINALSLLLLLCAVDAPLHFVADMLCLLLPMLALCPRSSSFCLLHASPLSLLLPSILRSLIVTRCSVVFAKISVQKNSCRKIFGDFPSCFYCFCVFVFYIFPFSASHHFCITALIAVIVVVLVRSVVVVACNVLVAFAARLHFYWASCRFRFHVDFPCSANSSIPRHFCIVFMRLVFLENFGNLSPSPHHLPLIISPPSCATSFNHSICIRICTACLLPPAGSIQPQRG